jgi:hypothetical protein
MMKTEREIDTIRGKLLVGHTTVEENHAFLEYVSFIEGLVEDASIDDYFGTEGWRHLIGWD